MAHLCKLVHCATKVQRVVWRDNARYLRARSKHTGADTCSAVQGCPVFEGTFWSTHSPLSLHTLITASSLNINAAQSVRPAFLPQSLELEI